MFVEDLSIFFADFGVPAVWTPSPAIGGPQQSATVLFDEPAEMVLGDSLVVSNVGEITYAVGQLTGLDDGENLTVNGVAFHVRQRPRKIDDGRLMKALISR